MITTPLAPIVAFLRRHKQGLEVLDGAPLQPDPIVDNLEVIEVADLEQWTEAPGELYLGRAEICPAAFGWAARVLAVAKGASLPSLVLLSVSARYVRIERDGVLHEWRWDTEGNTARLTSMADPTPPTPAARLKAVIEYEVGR